MIEGATVRLRAWHEADLPVMTLLRNDVALQAQLLARARGSDEMQVRRWLQDRSANSENVFFIIADKQTDRAIGFVQVMDVDPIDRRGDLGICLSRGETGKGAGRESIALLLRYLRDVRKQRKLSLRVRTDNAAAINCYRKLGFLECGRLREHVFIDGAWQDLILMEIFLERADH